MLTGVKIENKPMTTELDYYMTAVKTRLTCLFCSELCLELCKTIIQIESNQQFEHAHLI